MSKPDNICFIGSTLPISFIIENHLKLNIKKIYVPNQKLETSAKFINNKINKRLDIKSLPENKFFQFLNLFIIFLTIKIKDREVILFHEISWLVFDIAFHLLNPKYKFFPQVTLNSYCTIEEINSEKILKAQKGILILSKLFDLLFKLGLFPKFKLLFVQNDNTIHNEIYYVGSFSCQDYKVSKIKKSKKIFTKA